MKTEDGKGGYQLTNFKNEPVRFNYYTGQMWRMVDDVWVEFKEA